MFAFSILGFDLGAQATARFTAAYKQAHESITQLRFQEAQSIIAREQRKDPNNRVSDYLKAAMICAELFINEDQMHYQNSQEKIDGYISRIEDLSDASPFRNLFLGELYVAQATLNGKFKNNIKAAWQFYKAYNYLTDNHKRFPDFAPTSIPLGVLYAAIGSLPDDYRSMASLLGFEGSVPEGMKMISTAYEKLSADQGLSFYKTYAGFVYSYVSFLLSTDVVTPESLGLDVSKSSILIYAQAQIELDRGDAERALKWLDGRPEGDAYITFNYLDYLQGKILLGLDPDRCVTYFTRYLENNTSQVYVKSTYRYLCWYYMLEGKKKKADEMRSKIFTQGEDNTGADRQAMLEARLGFNSVLVGARILFDVGKYSQAEKLLLDHPESNCCHTAVDEAEYYYRMGRIKQQQARGHQALIWYEKAMAVSGVEANYSLGNSALQTAEVLRGSGDLAGAKVYYRKTLKYSGFPFYEGLHQKAKAALSQL